MSRAKDTTTCRKPLSNTSNYKGTNLKVSKVGTVFQPFSIFFLQSFHFSFPLSNTDYNLISYTVFFLIWIFLLKAQSSVSDGSEVDFPKEKIKRLVHSEQTDKKRVGLKMKF